MRALLTLAAGRTRFLASPAEIAALLPKNLPHGDDAIDRGLSALSDGGYIDVVSTDRKGERTYAVELTGRGAGCRLLLSQLIGVSLVKLPCERAFASYIIE